MVPEQVEKRARKMLEEEYHAEVSTGIHSAIWTLSHKLSSFVVKTALNAGRMAVKSLK